MGLLWGVLLALAAIACGVPWRVAWSPDGRFVAYSVHDYAEDEIWITEVEGGKSRRIFRSKGRLSPPVYSSTSKLYFVERPAGRTFGLLFRNDGSLTDPIAVLPLDPKVEEKDFHLDDFFIALSPDESRAALVINHAPGKPGTLAMVDLASGGVRPILDGVSAAIWESEERLVAVLFGKDGASQLVRIGPDGTIILTLLPQIQIAWELGALAVSPSGRYIAFPSSDGGKLDLSVVDRDDGKVKLSVRNGYTPVWSRSEDILYHGVEIHETEHLVVRWDPSGEATTVFRSPFFIACGSLSPDGERLAMRKLVDAKRFEASPPRRALVAGTVLILEIRTGKVQEVYVSPRQWLSGAEAAITMSDRTRGRDPRLARELREEGIQRLKTFLDRFPDHPQVPSARKYLEVIRKG